MSLQSELLGIARKMGITPPSLVDLALQHPYVKPYADKTLGEYLKQGVKMAGGCNCNQGGGSMFSRTPVLHTDPVHTQLDINRDMYGRPMTGGNFFEDLGTGLLAGATLGTVRLGPAKKASLDFLPFGSDSRGKSGFVTDATGIKPSGVLGVAGALYKPAAIAAAGLAATGNGAGGSGAQISNENYGSGKQGGTGGQKGGSIEAIYNEGIRQLMASIMKHVKPSVIVRDALMNTAMGGTGYWDDIKAFTNKYGKEVLGGIAAAGIAAAAGAALSNAGRRSEPEPEPESSFTPPNPCPSLLASKGINSKREWRKWSAQGGHPDKGGDTPTYQRVTDCKEQMYGKGDSTDVHLTPAQIAAASKALNALMDAQGGGCASGRCGRCGCQGGSGFFGDVKKWFKDPTLKIDGHELFDKKQWQLPTLKEAGEAGLCGATLGGVCSKATTDVLGGVMNFVPFGEKGFVQKNTGVTFGEALAGAVGATGAEKTGAIIGIADKALRGQADAKDVGQEVFKQGKAGLEERSTLKKAKAHFQSQADSFQRQIDKQTGGASTPMPVHNGWTTYTHGNADTAYGFIVR
jgi:hypothetical protein